VAVGAAVAPRRLNNDEDAVTAQDELDPNAKQPDDAPSQLFSCGLKQRDSLFRQ
jgi:hypothetical protein